MCFPRKILDGMIYKASTPISVINRLEGSYLKDIKNTCNRICNLRLPSFVKKFIWEYYKVMKDIQLHLSLSSNLKNDKRTIESLYRSDR